MRDKIVLNFYQEIDRHLLEGAMVHDDLSTYFYFLELPGYGLLHEYHFLEEYGNYKSFYKYALRMEGELLKQDNLGPPIEVIPAQWYGHNKENIDAELKKKSILNGFDIWEKWETDTLAFYTEIYRKIYESNARYHLLAIVDELIKEVSEEIQFIKSEKNRLQSIGYDLSQIFDWQKNFKKKKKGLYVDRFNQ